MPTFSGNWSLTQQFQGRGQGLWPSAPNAPTIGTATAGNNCCASVTFTAATCAGYPGPIISYVATSTPGCITGEGTTSPITVVGLTAGTAYTFKVKARNSAGVLGLCSAASNSVTAKTVSQAAYTTAGTYSWVAPAGVTSVSVVAVGGGASGPGAGLGAAGGGLGWKNNISVTPGNSYTVVVGAGGAASCLITTYPGGDSYFINTSTVKGGGAPATVNTGQSGGTYTGDGGGNGGGRGGCGGAYGGGGAGGYTGNGGLGGLICGTYGAAGSGGGGGGGGSSQFTGCGYAWTGGGGGGGVGILGQCVSGVGGYGSANTDFAAGGSPGSGGGQGGVSCLTQGTRGTGGNYGGGGGVWAFIGCSTYRYGAGGGGAIRIIWPGTTRQFPSTNTGDL